MAEGRGFSSPTATNTAKAGAGTVDALVTSTVVAAANSDRTEITICNDHASQIVYLALGATAVANRGIRVNAAGGSYTTSAWLGSINAISVGGTSALTVAEI